MFGQRKQRDQEADYLLGWLEAGAVPEPRKRPKRSLGRKLALGATLIGLVAGGTVIAQAAIPSTGGGGGLITACYTTLNGATRIIDTDAGQACIPGERTVSWGGGMRFRGEWTASGPPAGMTPTAIMKGDVVRVAAPLGGCPAGVGGTYINVSGALATTILGFTPPCQASSGWVRFTNDGNQGPAGPKGDAGPQGPVGPKGPAGSDGSDTHWVRVSKDRTVITASETGFQVFKDATGAFFLQVPTSINIDECSLTTQNTGEPLGDNEQQGPTPMTVIKASRYFGFIYVRAIRYGTYDGVNVPIDVTLDCAKY